MTGHREERVLPAVDSTRFPALKRLSWQPRRRRVPHVQQMHMSDCGAACLAMVLAYHGRAERLETVRELVGIDHDGTDALALLQGARRLHLRGRGLRLEIADLRYLPAAAILHWEFNHFVVFERVTRRGVVIVDPASGRRLVPLDRFRRQFTGVTLVLEPTDAFEPGDRRDSPWSTYVKEILDQRRLLARVALTSLLLRLFALSLPLLTGLLVDRVVPRHDTHLLLVVGIGLSAVVVFTFLTELIRGHLLLQLRTNVDTRMNIGFLDHLVGLPFTFFQSRSAGDLMMRVSSNANVREILTTSTLSGILDGAMVLIYLCLVFAYSAPMALLVIALGTLQIAVFLAARIRVRELMAQDLEAHAKAQGYLVQLLAGVETLKATGAEDRAVEHWSNLFVDGLNVSLSRGRLQAAVDSAMVALRSGSPMLVLGFGALQVLDGDMSLGTMLALNAVAIGFIQPLSALAASGLQLQLLGSYVERIDDVLRADAEQAPGARHAPRLRGRIRLDDVSFRYSPRMAPVIRNVSVDVPPGSSVAVVGRSGSGKSTLAGLLLGLYQPSEGRISYDGEDLRELDLRTVRQQLGIVPQHPYIFGASIRSNIALSNPSIPLDRIVAAAKAACIHEDIIAMPMGYETTLCEGGSSLSGGQRQRLALARALVHRPAVILLDEATSALDAATEQQVTANLDALRCTRIVIAHRLSTIVAADLILVMHEGHIVERGTHDELLSRAGEYRQLVAVQASLRALEGG